MFKVSKNAFLVNDDQGDSSAAVTPLFPNLVTGRFSCEPGCRYKVVDGGAASNPEPLQSFSAATSPSAGLLQHWQPSSGLSPAVGAARFMQTAASVRASSSRKRKAPAFEVTEQITLKQISLVSVDISDDRRRLKVGIGQPIQTSNVQLREGDVSVPSITTMV